MKRRSLWLSALLLLALGGITLYVVHKELGGADILGTLKTAHPLWILAGILAMAIYAVLEAIDLSRALRLEGYRLSFSEVLSYAFAGFFFSSITPSSTGGQPAQLYFMTRSGVHASHGTFSLLCALMSYQGAAVIWGLIGVFFSPNKLSELNGRYSFIFLIGFAVNLLIIMFLWSILFSKKVTKLFARAALRFSKKKVGTLRFFASYRGTSAILRRHPVVLVKMLLTAFAEVTLYHSIPFLAARALDVTKVSWFDMASTQGLLFLSVSSLPLPGAAGVSEYGYAVFYQGLIPEGMLGSALLLSRFLSFVLPLVLSGIGLGIIQLNLYKRRIRR